MLEIPMENNNSLFQGIQTINMSIDQSSKSFTKEAGWLNKLIILSYELDGRSCNTFECLLQLYVLRQWLSHQSSNQAVLLQSPLHYML
jgi:hypothetical protein